MKRYITLECDSDMYSVYIWLNEGEAVCMTPLGEPPNTAVRAVPLERITGSDMRTKDVLAQVSELMFHKPLDVEESIRAEHERDKRIELRDEELAAKRAEQEAKREPEG